MKFTSSCAARLHRQPNEHTCVGGIGRDHRIWAPQEYWVRPVARLGTFVQARFRLPLIGRSAGAASLQTPELGVPDLSSNRMTDIPDASSHDHRLPAQASMPAERIVGRYPYQGQMHFWAIRIEMLGWRRQLQTAARNELSCKTTVMNF